MKNWILYITFLMMIIILVSCAGRYRIHDKTFSSSSKALQWYAYNFTKLLEDIKPTEKPIHGSVLVLIPSDAEILKSYIKIGENAGALDNEYVDFLIAVDRISFQFISDAIRKRGLFDSITVKRHNGNPYTFPLGDIDCVVFTDVDGWYIREKGNPKPSAILLDLTKPIDAYQTSTLLDSIAQKARTFK